MCRGLWGGGQAALGRVQALAGVREGLGPLSSLSVLELLPDYLSPVFLFSKNRFLRLANSTGAKLVGEKGGGRLSEPQKSLSACAWLQADRFTSLSSKASPSAFHESGVPLSTSPSIWLP